MSMIKPIAKIIKAYESNTFSGNRVSVEEAHDMAVIVWKHLKAAMESGYTMNFDGVYYSEIYRLIND